MEKRTALVTGATKGIGYELSRLLARDGFDLVLIARKQSRLIELADELKRDFGASSRFYAKDLSLPGTVDEIFRDLERHSVFVEVLVNNAGFGVYGLFLEQDWDAVLSMLNLNITALARFTHLFLPEMVKRGKGKILNVASTAAFQPGPLMAGYFASKAFVLSFSEALRCEVSGTGVTITALCPGTTKTDFQNRSGTEDLRIGMLGMMSASRAAKAGYRSLMRGQFLSVPGFFNKVMAFVTRFTPRSLSARVVQFLQRKGKASK